MKRLFILICLIPFYISLSIGEGARPPASHIKKKMEYEKFACIVAYIESKNNPLAIGKDNDFGLYQIREIRLRDYNNRTKNNYKINDLFNPKISRKIFDYYSQNLNFELASRAWNGWDYKMEKQSTKIYWNKISKLLNL
jgi:hypothetical protein